MAEWRCIGCGGPLQNTDTSGAFYTPKPEEKNVPVYCERCYKIRHYGQIKPSFMNETMVYDILYQVEKRPGVMVLITDALDFTGSLHPFFMAMSKAKRTIVVVNKVDLLPHAVSAENLKKRFLLKAKNMGLNVDELMLVSALKKKNIDALFEALLKASKGQDVYLMGLTNVGKSSVLNALLNAQGLHGSITTSFEPNITQDLIPFRLGLQTLYDTPGLTSRHSYRHFLSGASLRNVLALKEIKPRVYQNLKQQAFYGGGLFYVIPDATDDSTGIAYFSENLMIHHHHAVDPAAFYEAKKVIFLTPPTALDVEVPLVKTRLLLNGKKKDLVIPGLGFMTFNRVKHLDVFHYESVTPTIEEGLIG